jgi:hypothetical protein
VSCIPRRRTQKKPARVVKFIATEVIAAACRRLCLPPTEFMSTVTGCTKAKNKNSCVFELLMQFGLFSKAPRKSYFQILHCFILEPYLLDWGRNGNVVPVTVQIIVTSFLLPVPSKNVSGYNVPVSCAPTTSFFMFENSDCFRYFVISRKLKVVVYNDRY